MRRETEPNQQENQELDSPEPGIAGTAEESHAEHDLSSEIAEGIMSKVQDIDAEGTAYHFLLKGSENLEGILKDGLLGQELNMSEISILGSAPRAEDKEKFKYGKEWTKSIRKTKKGFVHFNIVGRGRSSEEMLDRDQYYDTQDNGTRIGNSFWIDNRNARTAVVFDISKYQELIPSFDDTVPAKSKTFRAREFWADGVDPLTPFTKKAIRGLPRERREFLRDVEYIDSKGRPLPEHQWGFVLSHRVAPRLFKGIVLFSTRKMTEAEKKDQVEKFRVRNSFEFPGGEMDERTAIEALKGRDEVENEDYSGDIQKIVSLMKEANKNRPEQMVPIYDIHGNLLWPRHMSHEDIKEMGTKKEKGAGKTR